MLDLMSDPKKKPGSRKKPDSKRSQGVDRHTQPRLAFHLPADLHSAFKAYLDATEPRPNESEVLRLALKRFLSSVRFWPPTSEDT